MLFRRVLYLSYDGMTDPLGQSQVLPYLVGLSKRGFQFTLISFEKSERYEKLKPAIVQICNANNITWFPLPYTKTPPILSTVKDLRALKKKIRALHIDDPFSIVHCRSYITALAGLWMKKKWGVKMIFDMRGFWADERVDGGLWNLKNPLFNAVYRYFKKKEKKFFEQADYTISLTHNAAQVIHSWTGIARQPIPIQVIPCCVDLGLFDPATIHASAVVEKRKELSIPDDARVVTYIGSIGTWYMLREMLSFFKRWLQKEPDAILLFVTNDEARSILAEAAALGLPDDNLRIRAANRSEVPLFIELCDYSLFFIKPVFSKKASSPTKQGEIMAMGKPIICNNNVGDTDYVVEKYNAGVLVEEFTDTAYDKVIDEIGQKKNFNVEAIRNAAKEFFSLEEGVRKYEEAYLKSLNG